MASRTRFAFALPLLAVLAGCPAEPSDQPGPDGDMTGDGDGSGSDVAELCSPACAAEPNADVECTAFATCESTCSDGFARCGDSCVTESVTQCGDGCEACPTPQHGAGVCSGGVCGVVCEPGYVECDGYSGPSCCLYASEVIAPTELGGYMPSVAVDAQGLLHVAYYRAAEHELVYASESSAGITRESARWYWSSGGGAKFQLALAKRGPVIAYTYPNSRSGLFIADRRANGWSQSTLYDASTPGGFAIAADRAGRVHVCFTEYGGGLRYAIRKGDKWSVSPLGVEPDAKGACAIAVDRDGAAHIAFYRQTAGDVIYTKGSVDGTFSAPVVVDSAGNVGSELAITVSATGVPYIAAYRSDTQDLRWATITNGNWIVRDVIDGGRVGSSPRIALAAGDQPVVTFWDADYYRVAIAVRQTNGTWAQALFEDVSGGAASLASAPDGSVWVATGDRDVLVHNLAGDQWASYGIDMQHEAGTSVALLQRAAQPVAVYTQSGDDGVSHVEVATRSGGAWTYTQLATAGTDPAAAIDAAGRTHVAYQTSAAISYATDTGGSFAIETVAASGAEPAIAVTDAGTAYVAYVANVATSSYALVLAKRGTTGWTTTTIGAAAAYGTYRFPVVRVVGSTVHVQWYDGVAKQVVYASSADGYTKSVVEATADGGGHDLWVSPAGVPHACVFRKTSSSWPDLRYATRASSTWSSAYVSKHGSALDTGRCAIAVDAAGTIGIARSMVYGAGLGELVLTTIGSATTHAVLQDDFYSAGIGMSVGASGFEVAASGRPYNGSGNEQYRVRWAHK